MQRDKKVGLALAILLCSIVGAFFIRDEVPRANAPELKDPKPLDSKIAQGDKLPYSESDARRSNAGSNAQRNDRNARPWEIPEYLNPDADRSSSSRNKKNSSKDPFDQRSWGPDASGTIALTPPTDDESPAVPMPEHNKDWAVRQKNGDVVALKNGETTAVGSGNLRSHVVIAGETLSSIAGKYLGTQARYLDIFQANRDQLKSPDDLKVGMKLNIPDRHADTKSNSVSKGSSVERTAPNSNSVNSNSKTTRQPPVSTTSKVTDKSKSSDAGVEPSSKKVQFKPSKTGPAIRRSAEKESVPSADGKSLSQTPPPDFQEVDDGILAELEGREDSHATIANNSATTETTSSVPRVAQADRDETPRSVTPEARPNEKESEALPK